MKSITESSVGYGIVTLSQNIRAKRFILAKVHNEGGSTLFNFLADCLAGNLDTAVLNRPVKIMLLKKGDNELQMASNTEFIHLLSAPERVYSSDEGIVRYSFIIPQSMLSNDFNAIGLYANTATATNLENYAALCDVNRSTVQAISSSSVLAVDWELHISNTN